MGIDKDYTPEQFEDSLYMARRVALYNCEVIETVKSLILTDEDVFKQSKKEHDKFITLLQTNYPGIETEIVLANPTKPVNHDLIKLDIDTIQNHLLDNLKGKNNKEDDSQCLSLH
jgi:hypothetical protein